MDLKFRLLLYRSQFNYMRDMLRYIYEDDLYHDAEVSYLYDTEEGALNESHMECRVVQSKGQLKGELSMQAQPREGRECDILRTKTTSFEVHRLPRDICMGTHRFFPRGEYTTEKLTLKLGSLYDRPRAEEEKPALTEEKPLVLTLEEHLYLGECDCMVCLSCDERHGELMENAVKKIKAMLLQHDMVYGMLNTYIKNSECTSVSERLFWQQKLSSGIRYTVHLTE